MEEVEEEECEDWCIVGEVLAIMFFFSDVVCGCFCLCWVMCRKEEVYVDPANVETTGQEAERQNIEREENLTERV